jgi:glycosyltransferase involved in cell wall biosynthesis
VSSETWIFQQNVFNYQSTKTICTQKDGLLLRELKRFLAIIQVAIRFDVIHFNAGATWASPVPIFGISGQGYWSKVRRFIGGLYLNALFYFEIGLYRVLGKPLFVHYQGDDARQGDFCLRNFHHSIAQYVDEGYYTPETDALKRRMIRCMTRYCEHVYAVNPDLMHILGSAARFVPYSHISLDEWSPVYNQLEARPLRIGHAPSHRKVKGTDLILEALDQLASEGQKYELVLVEGLSNVQARMKYEQIDVLIDQLHAGWYGGLAVEAMALGKPVMVYIRDEDLKFIPKEMKADLPFIRVTVETLKDELRQLIQMPRIELYKIAQISRRYVERWHDPLQIANEVKKDYEIALRSKKRNWY